MVRSITTSRYGKSPVVASVIIMAMGLVLGTLVFQLYKETAFSYVDVHAVEFVYIYSESLEDTDNVGWKIHFKLVNRGTDYAGISDVFLNDRIIDKYDLTQADNLEDGLMTGTSLPENGVSLASGEGIELFVLVGDELFSPGTAVAVGLNLINNVAFHRVVILN